MHRMLMTVFNVSLLLVVVVSCLMSVSAESSSSFGFGGIYSNAANRAANEIAQNEKQRRRQSSHHPSTYQTQITKKKKEEKEKKKKTMEEAIQAAKQMPRVLGGEGDDESLCDMEEASQEEPPITIWSDDSNDSDGSDDILAAILSSEVVSENDFNDKNKTTRRQRRRQRRKRRKRFEQQPSQSPTLAPTEHHQQQQQQHSPPPSSSSSSSSSSLIGQVILQKFLITEKIRVGSTKSELYKCYHISDAVERKYPLVMKLSKNYDQILLEHRIYVDLYNRLSNNDQERKLFTRVYDWIDYHHHEEEEEEEEKLPSFITDGKLSGFVMECGIENLRGHLWRYGPYTGEKLRHAMETTIRIVYTLHNLGTVWTEVKAENLIVFVDDDNDNNNNNNDGNNVNIVIKAVDLESVAGHKEFLRAYTAETYPPEFPPDSLYEGIPQIPLDYSFDIWGLGLVLFEIATGQPLFTLQKTYDIDYIKERLKDPEGIIQEAAIKLRNVHPGARSVIQQCLVIDPKKRSSCKELLQNEYFNNNKSSTIQK